MEKQEQNDNEIKVVEIKQIDEKPKEKEQQGENINVRAAIVHMIGDMVQSLGVIVAALIIYFKPEWKLADPICTFLFSILVMLTTVPIFIDCMRTLLETSPGDKDIVEIFNAIQNVSVLIIQITNDILDALCLRNS